jgi:hypothetical protein
MIKKRNLDPSLIQWIQTQTGIGYGLGKIKHLVPANSSTSKFRSYLWEMGVLESDIFTTFAKAYEACAAYRNDVIIVFPGDYAATAAQSIDKDNVHVLGTDPNIEGDYGQGGCNIYTTTANDINDLWDISAKRSTFANLKITNAGNDTGNLGAVKIYGEGNVFKRVAFMGIMAANQLTEAHAYSLCIDRGGYFPLFEDCIIGQNTWGPRSGACGHLWFANAKSGYPMDNGTFRRCKFTQWSATATSPLILADLNSMDRIWLFDSCSFYNYNQGVSTQLNQVFDDNDTFYTHTFVLHNCVAHGFHEWSDHDIGFINIAGSMPESVDGGGLTKALTDAVA